MIVISDFDGTLTETDVTSLLWDKYLPYDWRAALVPRVRSGELTPLEMIARGYADLPIGPEEVLAEARAGICLRPGLDSLTRLCADREWPFLVLSHGIDVYIRALLPPSIPFVSFVGDHVDGRWFVSLPTGVVVSAGEDFKRGVVAEMKARHPGHTTVYLGDGPLDLQAARSCDRPFAVRGSKLAELMSEAETFDTLDEVVAALELG
jgi:2-hydroxy-3-keto-5-methylthiopentenyl-1-phosphate phosphatase